MSKLETNEAVAMLLRAQPELLDESPAPVPWWSKQQRRKCAPVQFKGLTEEQLLASAATEAGMVKELERRIARTIRGINRAGLAASEAFLKRHGALHSQKETKQTKLEPPRTQRAHR